MGWLSIPTHRNAEAGQSHLLVENIRPPADSYSPTARKSVVSQKNGGDYRRIGAEQNQGVISPSRWWPERPHKLEARIMGLVLPLSNWEAVSHLRKLPRVRMSPHRSPRA